jgi:hypothetical protein
MLRTVMLAALALTALAGAIACGDDDTDSEGGADSTATSVSTARTPSGNDDASPDATEDNSDDDGGEDDEPATSVAGNDEDAEDFTDLAARNEDASYVITYRVSFESDGETNEGLWTFVQDPPRSSMQMEVEGSTIWAINDGESQYTCFETGPDEGQCLKSSEALPTGDILDPGEAVEDAEDAPNVREVDGREIAGRDARCFEFEEDGSSGLMCLDEDEGFLLFLEAEDTLMEATDVSTDIPGDAFEPPFDVIG